MSDLRPDLRLHAVRGGLVALLALVGLMAVPSLASATKTVCCTFGATSGATAFGGTFGEIRDVAIYEGTVANPAPAGYGGDIYAVDRGGNRIQRLGSNGAFEVAFGRDVIQSGKPGDLGIAFERCVTATDCKAGVTAASSGEFSSPQGVAINQDTGNVYVWDRTNRRVQEFDKDGNFIRMWGRDVVTTGRPNNVSTTAFEVCDVTNSNLPADCKQGTAGTAAGEFGTTSPSANNGIAVQPGTGDVFVIDPVNRRLQKFEANGSLPIAIGSSAVFGTNNPAFVAADANGIIYASNSNGSNQIERYNTNTSVFLAPIAGGTEGVMQSTQATSGLEVDSSTGHLLVARGAASTGGTAFAGVRELQIPIPASDPVTTLVDTHQPSGGFSVNGMGVDTSAGRIYLTASEPPASTNRIVTLDEDGASPSIATVGPSTEILASSAKLNGIINPNGVGLDTTYHFEISRDGASWTDVAPDASIGDGILPIIVDDVVSGLQANTLYRVRLVATKELNGGETISSETTFVTDALQPDVTTIKPSPRRTSSATLQARINPNGSTTTYYFEYGISPTYGQRSPILDANAGAGGVPKLFYQQIDDLQPAMTYHYRVVAENPIGISYGADISFTTRALHGLDADRGHELVSPRIKQTGPGVGGHGNQSQLDDEFGLMTGLPSLDGDRVISSTQAGPVLSGGASVFANDVALSQRALGGWDSYSAFNRQNYATVPSVPFLDFTGANSKLSLMSFDNTGGFSLLFPSMDIPSWYAGIQPKYLRDWNGNWELIQPTDPAAQGTASSGRETVAVAADGHSAVFTNEVKGVLGVTVGAVDPSVDQVNGRTTYLQDVSTGVSNAFPGGHRSLVGVCTGVALDGDRTLLPTRLASGKISAGVCPPADAGRSAALTSSRGAATAPTAGINHSVRNVVSENGARVFFMSPDPAASDPDGAGGPLTGGSAACGTGTGPGTSCPAQLFVSERDGAGPTRKVRWISRPEVVNQDASLLGPSYFEGASEDGDKVFFRTTSPLTADDPNGGVQVPGGITTGTASTNSWDLYMYDFPDGPGADPGSGTLTRITAGPTGDANTNLGVTTTSGGALRFTSADGMKSYFVTAAPIPGVPASSGTTTEPQGTNSTTTTSNLYFYDSAKPVSARWQFVALIPRESSGTIATCASTAAGSGQSRLTRVIGSEFVYATSATKSCLRGTDDGEFITFWTTGGLVGNDPDNVTGDVYGFDAGAGELNRLSAPQGGLGGTYLCDSAVATDVQCFGDGGFATGDERSDRWRPALLGVTTQPTVVGDHQAFFESRSQLVPQDTNSKMDVYQWRNGDLSLISTGASDEGVYYSGNNDSGRDVFVVTRDILSWEDGDRVRDVYDIRIDGGFDQPVPSVVCGVLGGACQGDGGGSPLTAPTASLVTGAEGTGSAGRVELSLDRPTSRMLRKAAATGRLPIVVHTTRAGRVALAATVRIGEKSRTVARRSRTMSAGGGAKIILRLGNAVRRKIRHSGGVRLTLRVSSSGARTRSITVRLPGVAS